MTVDLINHLALNGIKIAVISGCALALVATSRNTSATNLHRILLFVLIACVSTPLLSILLPPLPVPVLPVSLANAAEFTLSASPKGSALVYFIGFYVLVAFTFFAKLGVDLYRLRRLRLRAGEVSFEALVRHFPRLLEQLSIRGRVNIRCTDQIEVPVTWGLFRHYILLPAHFSGWSEPQLLHVLLHELAHIKRGDWLTKIFCQVAVALCWPLPSLWLLRAKLFWFAELACDDCVLESGVSRSDYAESLLRFAAAKRAARAGSSLVDASEAFRRIGAVLDGTRVHKSSSAGAFIFALVGSLLLIPFSALQLTALKADPIPMLRLLPMQTLSPLQPAKPTLPAENTALRLPDLKANIFPPDEHFSAPTQVPLSLAGNTYGDIMVELTVPALPDSLPVELSPTRILQVPPIYPRRALVRGQEGVVTVEFDITAGGSVINERVVSASPAGVFDEAALQALRDSRYSPRYINGRATGHGRLQEVFRFELNEDAKLNH